MKQKPKGEREVFPSFPPRKLKTLLEEHATAYNTGSNERVDVEFTRKTPHWDHKNEVIRLNPMIPWKTAQESGLGELDALRLLLDTLSHEVEHIKQTPRGSVEEFIEEFPEYPKTASAILNIIEDCYIDHQRLQEFEGLKRPFDIATEAKAKEIFKNVQKEDNRVLQMIMVTQLTMRGEIGFPDGLKIKDLFIKQFQKEVEEEVKDVPDMDDFEERREVAKTVTSTVLNYAPDDFEEEDQKDKLEDLLDKLLEDLAEELEKRLEDLPDDMREKLEEQMEERIEQRSAEIEAEPEEKEEVEQEQASNSNSGSNPTSAPSQSNSGGNTEQEGSLQDPDVETSNERETIELEDDEVNHWGEDPGGDGGNTGNVVAGGKVPDEIPEWVKEGVSFSFDEEEEQTVAELSEDVEQILEQLKPKGGTREVNATKGSKLDIRKAIRHKAGDTTERKVFKKKKREDEERTIGVTLDCSGSMDGRAVREGRAAVGALGRATNKTGDNYAVNTFFTDAEYNENGLVPKAKTVISAENEFDEDKLEKIKVHDKGPMGKGVLEIEEEIEDEEGKKIIFALGDGEPNVATDGTVDTDTAENEVKEEIERIRNREDFEVIGIAVGSTPNDRAFDKMFGEDGWFRFRKDELAEKLLTVYRNKVR